MISPSTAMAPIALTCGEPAGIGPELAAKAWTELKGKVPFFLIGDPAHLPENTDFTLIEAAHQATSALSIPVLAHRFPAKPAPGMPDPRNAQGVIDVVAKAVELVKAGDAGAVCTLPIHKKALKDGAEFPFPGHTEYLAHLGG